MTEDHNAITLDRIITALECLADSADAIAGLLAAPAALAATGPRLDGVPLEEPQPAADGWIEWHGSSEDMDGPRITYMLRSGTVGDATVNMIDWRETGETWNITAYKVIE